LRKLFPSLRERALSCYNCSTEEQTLQKAHNAREYVKNLYSNTSGIMTLCCPVYCASWMYRFYANNEATPSVHPYFRQINKVCGSELDWTGSSQDTRSFCEEGNRPSIL